MDEGCFLSDQVLSMACTAYCQAKTPDIEVLKLDDVGWGDRRSCLVHKEVAVLLAGQPKR